MANLIGRLGASGKGLWLDHGAYSARLLSAGTVPWMDAGAAIAWMRKAQSLLRSDVVSLPLRDVAAAWLAAHPGTVSAMAARKRAVYPLKTLLADEALRAHLVALVKSLRSSFADQILVLALPSPRHWMLRAYAQAHSGDTVEIEADDVDSAAVYVADFLRGFADCGIDGVLLEESPESAPSVAQSLPLYQPLLNVAAHYRWDAGLLLPADAPAPVGEGLDFVVASGPVAGSAQGLRIPARFWQDGQAPPCPSQGFRFAEIPADAHPEGVLERLASLR